MRRAWILAAAGLALAAGACGRHPAAHAVLVLSPAPGLAPAREEPLLREQEALLRSPELLAEALALLPDVVRSEVDAAAVRERLAVERGDWQFQLDLGGVPSAELILGRLLAVYLQRTAASREFVAAVTGTAVLR